MKINDFKKELRSKSVQELQDELDNLRRELFSLRLNSSTTHIKDVSQFSKLRKNIARTLGAIRSNQS